jgi:fermentation-respiration switch protein FrsA (DUF1100 family)
MTPRHVVFSHGQESGPWGTKIAALAQTARAQGCVAHSVDYQGIRAPLERVAKLLEYCRGLGGELLLAGSSVGGYVSVVAALQLHPRGVFLMAPALYLPVLPPLPADPLDCPATLVHGWDDTVVPYEHSVRFAHAQGATLHLLAGDHSLHGPLPHIQRLFEGFLQDLA